MLFYLWPVGEMVNTVPSQGIIHGFKSRTGHQRLLLVEILVFYKKKKNYLLLELLSNTVKPCCLKYSLSFISLNSSSNMSNSSLDILFLCSLNL